MTTTELIKLLQSLEFGGATGLPREISFKIPSKLLKRTYIWNPTITVYGTGDGTLGADITLKLDADENTR